MQRWVKVSVTAAVVMSVVGWFAQPYVKDWWLVRDACDGGLPAGAARELAPDGAHFTDVESRTLRGLGEYRCTVTVEDDDRDIPLVSVQAYTGRAAVETQLLPVDRGFQTIAAMPEGLPGFVNSYRGADFLVKCPDLPKDADGRTAKLLTHVTFDREATAGRPAAYEAAVALTNSISERLGCGATPLKVPAGAGGLPDPEAEKPVWLDEAGGTGCEWAQKAGLPSAPAMWRVIDRMNDAAPMGRCDFQNRSSPDAELSEPLAFASWYGDWTDRLLAKGRGRWPAATARCDGEAAHFVLSADDTFPGLDKAKQRTLLKAFAEAKVRKHGCTDLRMDD
ncbi:MULTISPECIES: hypothetical protein [unclassified Streptomyces]|uniref:hypothetical protein n=1 Tax=unclassified Streptomyces TaxID=2593676 RepID=UPI000DD823A6|nr:MULTISPECIES: hypothetical protein [unclassified Streptomyces]QZZ31563.1 hypothetical protein A7X85_39900 [Streptomyces sp. ST1015]